MPNRIDRHTTFLLRQAVWLGSLLAALLGLGVLVAWAVELSGYAVLLPALLQPVMAPPTALGLMLAGGALALQQTGFRRAAFLSALVLLLFAGTMFACRAIWRVDPLTAWVLGDLRPYRQGHLIRIARTSSGSFLLLAIGLLAVTSRWRWRRQALMATSLPGLVLSGLVLICYAYEVDRHSPVGFYSGMSPHAAIGLFILFLMSLAIEPERGWLVALMSGRPSARASRMQILLVTTVPLIAGYLLLQQERAGTMAPGLAMAAMAVCTITPLAIQVLRDGRMLDELEDRRQQAVAAKALLNEEFEQRVRARTARLARSEARLRGFVDQAVEGLALLRLDRDGVLSIETASPSLVEKYAVAQPLPGTGLPVAASLILQPDVIADLMRHIGACLETGEPQHYRALRESGDSLRVLDIVLAAIKGDGIGTEQLLAVSVRDVTDVEMREEQLRQSQKMEAVGQLTGGLAHDFNNLLAGISGSLEIVQMRLAAGRTDGLERYLSTAQESGRRAASLTHRLLAFSRRQTLDPRPIVIDRLVAGMEELISRTVGPAVTVSVQSSPEAWTSLIDANQFENALLNLCLNARDAMPEGGRISISTSNETVGACAATSELPAGDYVRIRVADTGVGMSQDLVARAFDPFFTTKPLGQGTGLGLSMIYGFVRQSGGKIELLSEPGRGTIVDLHLPRQVEAVEAEAAPAEDDGEIAAGDGRTVLVVDDEPAIRMLVCDILEDRGYRTITAADGIEGLKIVQSPGVIDLLVTDVGLPNGMNGRQLADAARSARPDLKILFITGYAETSVLGESGILEKGMEILTKPFTIARLMDRVGALAARVPASSGEV